jgi:hypothetical protein
MEPIMTTLPVLRQSLTTCLAFCQHCGQRVTLQIAPLQQGDHTLTVSCVCDHEMQLVRERRRFERKAVHLSGALLDQTTHRYLTNVSLSDLSLGGVGFVSHQPNIEVEDLFTLCFQLDDACHTTIQEDIVVRSVRERQYIGAEFLYKDGYNFDLDFYLNPYVVML